MTIKKRVNGRTSVFESVNYRLQGESEKTFGARLRRDYHFMARDAVRGPGDYFKVLSARETKY